MERFKRKQRLYKTGISVQLVPKCEVGKLGQYDESTGEIKITQGQGAVGTTITLMHEMLHAVDHAIVAGKILKRHAAHGWIENAAGNLVWLMAEAGMLRDVSRPAMRRFIKHYKPERPSYRKRRVK